MQPWPMAYTFWKRPLSADPEPMRLIIHKTEVVEGEGAPGLVLEAIKDRLIVAAGGGGSVRILSLQVPGKKVFTTAEFLRGHRILDGETLGL